MLRVEQNYVTGLPQTILPNFVATGAGWHWSAGGPGRAGWDGTVRYLVDSRYTVNASYHGGFWHEHDTETTVLQWVVLTTRAAHSVNPAQSWQHHPTKDRATQDARFAEVRRILGAKASDPNAGMLALAYSGMPDDLERDLACPVFRADVQDLGRQLVAHPTIIDRPHFGHGWIQPISRYEMDVATDFIGLLYEGDSVLTRPVRELWKIPSGTQFWTGGPAMGEQKVFTADVELWSNGETTDGLWRRIEYGNEELYLRRKGMTPIPGTRNPATGYGAPSTGFTQEQLDAEKAKANAAGFGNAKAQSIVAAENHLATVRALK